MAKNYQLKLDKEIESLQGERPELLLHSCCGPCSSYVLEYLSQYYQVTLLWYNPNIWPQEENDKRLYYQRKIIDSLGLQDKVRIVIPSDGFRTGIGTGGRGAMHRMLPTSS